MISWQSQGPSRASALPATGFPPGLQLGYTETSCLRKKETEWRKILFFSFYKTKRFKLIDSLRQEINGSLKGIGRIFFLLDHFKTYSFISEHSKYNEWPIFTEYNFMRKKNVSPWNDCHVWLEFLPRSSLKSKQKAVGYPQIAMPLLGQCCGWTCLFVHGGLPSTFLHHQS